MRSVRFDCPVVITRHAAQRMAQRRVSPVELMQLIESGDLHFKDASRLWISIRLAHRDDNRVCAAAAIERSLIIKTVMTRWEPLL